MKIRTKIALQFTLVVAIILALFSLVIYYLSENYRKKEFYESLKDRAVTTARLLIKEQKIDRQLLKVIDKNTLTTLYPAQVTVFNDSNQVAYYNYEADTVYYNRELLNKVRSKKYIETTYADRQVVGTMYADSLSNYVVLAQAEDIYGKIKLKNIFNTMITGFFWSVLFSVLIGFIFAGQSLRPISKINEDIRNITASNLKNRLKIGGGKDEISTLAKNFNKMLSRLEQSFELQKSFVSNASHELRTPLAAVKSEIQVALEKDRTPEEYKNILESILNDNQRLINLTNGLLLLAKSENKSLEYQNEEVRLDEVLFKIQDELSHDKKGYHVYIDFEEIPDELSWVTVKGNEVLLKTIFGNLIDNACKYSANHTAEIKIKANKDNCIIAVNDSGIGIPKAEIEHIFQPFYRTQNVSNYYGTGIGLSICKRIVNMMGGKILVKSELNKGSQFVVVLPHI